MDKEDSFQDPLEAADECLQLIEESVKSVKETVSAEENSVESKKKATENTKITIEASKRTLEALRRNLEAIQISIESDNASTNDARNSSKVLDEILKCKKKIESNGINIAEEENHLNSEGVNADVPGKGGKNVEHLNGVKKKTAAGRSDDKAEENIYRSADNDTKTVRMEYTKYFNARECNEGTIKAPQNGEISEEATAEGKKFTKTWNTALNSDITVNGKTAEVNMKSVRNKDKHPLLNEEFMQRNGNLSPIDENGEADSSDCCNLPEMEGMDNPLNAMLFSEHLIEYVLNKLGYIWPCVDGARNLPKRSVMTRFSKIIGEVVIAIIDSNIWMIADSYKRLINKNVHTIESFRIEVCVTATFYFDEGYTHNKFLVYAAQLAGLSAFYFASGNMQIAEASAQVMAYILNFYIYQLCFSPTYDWFNLHLEAQKLRREILEGKILFVMPSDKTEASMTAAKNIC